MDMMDKVTMNDVIHRTHTVEGHRSLIPDFGVYTFDFNAKGEKVYYILSRQLVIFNVERRKAWRMLQSRAGIVGEDYLAQKALLHNMDNEEMNYEEAKASV
jgi:pyruvate-ferredoxin/flavodoxin oxidoreductase